MREFWPSKYKPVVRGVGAEVAGRGGPFGGEGMRCDEDVGWGWCDALRPRRRLEVCCCCGGCLAGDGSPHRSPKPPPAAPPGGGAPPYPWMEAWVATATVGGGGAGDLGSGGSQAGNLRPFSV